MVDERRGTSALVLRLGQNIYLPTSFIALSGIDGLRFTAPVKLGDTIHSMNRVAGLDVKDASRGILQYESEILNQNEKTVVRWTSRMLVGRRPGA